MLQYHEIFSLAMLFNNTMSTTDIQTVGIPTELQHNITVNIGKHHQSHLRMFIMYMRNIANKMFWPKSTRLHSSLKIPSLHINFSTYQNFKNLNIYKTKKA
jgi:hypothetical protein